MTERKRHACGLLRGAWINRPNGQLALVEDLRVGDTVTTLDRGPMPILRIETETISPSALAADPDQRPWIYTPDQSEDDGLHLHGDHLILWYPGGCTDTLIAARDLARCRPEMCRQREEWDAPVTWYRIHLEGHQLIAADGYPVETARAGLPGEALARGVVTEVSEWA